MRVNAFCCLMFALALSCNVCTATMTSQIFMEGTLATLPCRHHVSGAARWSREINGMKTDIFKIDGEKTTRYNDPQKRYTTIADGKATLYIQRVVPTDAGKYFCNNGSAVTMIVVPSGTKVEKVAEGSSFTLTCPRAPTWIRTVDSKPGRLNQRVTFKDQTMRIANVQLRDSGLYYCEGKPVTYLNVTKEERTTTQTTSTSALTNTTHPSTPSTTSTEAKTTKRTTTQTTTTGALTNTTPPSTPSTTSEKAKTTSRRLTEVTKRTQPSTTSMTATTPMIHTPGQQTWVLATVLPILLLLLLLLLVLYCARRRNSEKRAVEQRNVIYEEIEANVIQPSNAFAGPSAVYSLAHVPGASNQDDATYSTIPDPPQMANKTGHSVASESPYSLLNTPAQDKKGTILPDNSTYFLLQKPKALGNINDAVST